MKGIWDFAKRKPIGAICLFILVFFGLLAILGSWVAPSDPIQTSIEEKLTGPNWQHPFGTDQLGRDVFSRVIVGTRLSFFVGISVTLLGLFLAFVIAIPSAYYGGRYDLVAQRVVDIFMAFPLFILAMAIIAVLGPSVLNVIISLVIAIAPRLVRVIRSSALSTTQTEYVMAAKALGASAGRIMLRHIAPNTFAVAIVYASAMLGGTVLAEASLSFLGIGIPPPLPSWGRDLSDASRNWALGPWLAIFPGLALSLFVLVANLLGDALRDDLDPRLKRV